MLFSNHKCFIFLTKPESFPVSLYVHIPRVDGINKRENTLLKEGPALTTQGKREYSIVTYTLKEWRNFSSFDLTCTLSLKSCHKHGMKFKSVHLLI